MFCSVNPSEDPEKTRKSISNIFPYSTTKNENYSISAESNDLTSLERIYEQYTQNNLRKPMAKSPKSKK